MELTVKQGTTWEFNFREIPVVFEASSCLSIFLAFTTVNICTKLLAKKPLCSASTNPIFVKSIHLKPSKNTIPPAGADRRRKKEYLLCQVDNPSEQSKWLDVLINVQPLI